MRWAIGALLMHGPRSAWLHPKAWLIASGSTLWSLRPRETFDHRLGNGPLGCVAQDGRRGDSVWDERLGKSEFVSRAEITTAIDRETFSPATFRGSAGLGLFGGFHRCRDDHAQARPVVAILDCSIEALHECREHAGAKAGSFDLA